MKKVLLMGNHEIVIYNFRKEFIKRLIDNNYQVYIVLPYGEKVEKLKKMGCQYIEGPLERHGMNPIKEMKILCTYYSILITIKPDIVFTYTIKPNIYGSIACRIKKIPCVATITGIGSAFNQTTFLRLAVTLLYRFSFKKVQTIFFQNEENQKFFDKQKIILNRYQLVHGSGVNLEEFSCMPYPEAATLRFAFIGRITKEKGIREYLEAAKILRKKYAFCEFHICGFIEEDCKNILENAIVTGDIYYHGMVEDIRAILKNMHCVVLPSYHEGMSNALLEAAACGRPLIASDIPGCSEIVDVGINGLLSTPKNAEALTKQLEKFIDLDYEIQKKWGENSRRKVENEFDRNLISDLYMNEIH